MSNNPWLIINLHDDFLHQSLIYIDEYIEKADGDKLYHVVDELLDAKDDIVSLRKELFNIARLEKPFSGFIKEIQLTKEDDNETIERNLHNAIKLLTNIEVERDSFVVVSGYWNTIIDWFQFIPREMTDYIKSNLNNWR